MGKSNIFFSLVWGCSLSLIISIRKKQGEQIYDRICHLQLLVLSYSRNRQASCNLKISWNRGWVVGLQVSKIRDSVKYVFSLVRVPVVILFICFFFDMRRILQSFCSKHKHPKEILGLSWMFTKFFYKLNKEEIGCTEKELLYSIVGTMKSWKYVMH